MEEMILSLITTNPTIGIGLAMVGSLVTIATAVIPFTSTKKDDESWTLIRRKIGPFLNFVERFSIIRRKP